MSRLGRRGLIRKPVSNALLPNYATAAFFGDSVTAGTGASDAAHRWVNLLAGTIGATLSNQGLSGRVLQNSNDSGGAPRTGNGRDNYASAVLGANLKAAVFVALGFNDARYTGAPSTFNVTQYAADYREVLNGLIIGGYARSDIYVIDPYYITDTGLETGSTGFTGQTRIGFEEFVTAAGDVAEEFGVKYAPLYPYLRDNGFGATTTGDNIHPDDTGHAMIAAGIPAVLVVANTRGAPSSVTGSDAGGGVANVSCVAAPGSPDGYEWQLLSNPVTAYSTTSVGTTASFSGVTGGSYYVKCRAVYGSDYGPWAFSASAVTVVTGSGVTFLSDSFTDPDGTLLTDHTPEIGGAWVVQTGYTPSVAAKISAGRVQIPGTGSGYRNTAAAPSADGYVEAEIDRLSAISNETIGVAIRMSADALTLYWADFRAGENGWRMFKAVNGINTQLGTTQPDAFTSGPKFLRLTAEGDQISMSVDGVTLLTVTDGDIAGPGYAGIRCSSSQSPTTGRQIDSIVAVTL